MEYHGKLYGKIGNKHFDTGRTSEEFDRMQNRLVEFELEKETKPMDIKEITKRNYNATVKRGLITPETTIWEFIRKINEEYKELNTSYIDPLIYSDELGFDIKELADIALVCFAMAEHYNIDLLSVIAEKTIYNEQRKD